MWAILLGKHVTASKLGGKFLLFVMAFWEMWEASFQISCVCGHNVYLPKLTAI